MCLIVRDVGGFSLSDTHLLLFFCRRDVVGLWVRRFAFPESRGTRRWCAQLIGGSRLLYQLGWLCFLMVTGHSQSLACHVRSRAWFTDGHSFAFPDGISCRVPGLRSFIQFLRHLPLLRTSSTFPYPLCSHSSNTFIGEMAHDGDRGKHPRNKDSSHAAQTPPPLG
jgi:hypothetical protein